MLCFFFFFQNLNVCVLALACSLLKLSIQCLVSGVNCRFLPVVWSPTFISVSLCYMHNTGGSHVTEHTRLNSLHIHTALHTLLRQIHTHTYLCYARLTEAICFNLCCQCSSSCPPPCNTMLVFNHSYFIPFTPFVYVIAFMHMQTPCLWFSHSACIQMKTFR